MATANKDQMLSKEWLEAAFSIFDTVKANLEIYWLCLKIKDCSGAISIEELKNNFGGSKFFDDIWKGIIKEFDENEDGGSFCLD